MQAPQPPFPRRRFKNIACTSGVRPIPKVARKLHVQLLGRQTPSLMQLLSQPLMAMLVELRAVLALINSFVDLPTCARYCLLRRKDMISIMRAHVTIPYWTGDAVFSVRGR